MQVQSSDFGLCYDLKLTTGLAEKLNWIENWPLQFNFELLMNFMNKNLPAAAGRGTGEVFGRSYDGIVSWISAGVAGNPWLMTTYCTGRVMVGGGGQVLGRQRLWWPNLWLLLMVYWQVTLLSAGKFSPLLFLCPLSQSIQGEVVQVQIINLPVVKIVWNALTLQLLQLYYFKIYLARTRVRVSMVFAHSLTNSSQSVKDESTSRNWSHNSVETTTYRFALIHVTIRVWNIACKNT